MPLRQIVESELRVASGYETVAVLNATRDELSSNGIRLSLALDAEGKAFIEAGPIEEAFIEAATGEQALLVCPATGEPDPPWIEVRAPVSASTDPARFASAIIAALDLPEERRTWLISADEWHEWQQRYAALGEHC